MSAAKIASATERKDFVYEIKFLVSEGLAAGAIEWARANLQADPNGAYHSDFYRVHSLYFDTSSFDVYRRSGSYGRCKYRVRRYGEERTIFLERKLKTRGLVGKRRTRIPEDEIDLLSSMEPSPDWDGFWFHRRVVARNLGPKCQIAYDRVARVGLGPTGPVRLTLDRNLRAATATGCKLADDASWIRLLPDHCILELKYGGSDTPLIFKQLIERLSLTPQSVSKYRLTVEKFGWMPRLEPSSPNGSLTTMASHP